MFRQLILDTLIAGPKTTEQLYDAERLYWAYCTHRQSRSDMEWQHELRREQQHLKREDLIS
jgi:hypothetical protein